MSRPSVDTHRVDTRRPLHAGALALAALMLVTACTSGAPLGQGLTTSRSPVPHDSPEQWELESEAETGGQGEAFFAKLPTDFASVKVSNAK